MKGKLILSVTGLIIAAGLIALVIYIGNMKSAPHNITTAINNEGTYNGIEYTVHIDELQESLKLAGVSSHDYPNFQNIQKYQEIYKTSMQVQCDPYVEIGFSGDLTGGDAADWDYIFGCQVESLESLPTGLVGFDTGVKRFAVITFKADSVEALVGDAGGVANAMQTMTQFIKESWLPEHLNGVNLVHQDKLVFEIKNDGKSYYMNLLEVYKEDINIKPEMSLYIPLK